MKLKRLIIFSIIISIFLGGCASLKIKGDKNMNDPVNKNKNDIEPEQDKLATKEFLIDTFQLTEEDITKYDVEELISYFGLTEDFFLHEKENLKDLSSITIDFERLQKKMFKESEEDNYDFSYLVDGEEYKGDFPDIETIRYLAVTEQMGTGGTSLVIDFEKNIIYESFHSANLYTNIQYADEEVILTVERKNEIIQALKDAEIWDWNYMYSSKGKTSMERWWHFGAEFENGTVVSYNGAGDVPSNYKPLKEVLYNQ